MWWSKKSKAKTGTIDTKEYLTAWGSYWHEGKLTSEETPEEALTNKIKKEIWDGLVSCEKCKCLIKKCNAVEGKHVIKKQEDDYYMWGIEYKAKEYVHIPYYCHRCKPAKKKASKKKCKK